MCIAFLGGGAGTPGFDADFRASRQGSTLYRGQSEQFRHSAAVGPRWTLEDGKLWRDEPRGSRLVAIDIFGNLNPAQLAEKFNSALADQPTFAS